MDLPPPETWTLPGHSKVKLGTAFQGPVETSSLTESSSLKEILKMDALQ